MHLIPRRAMRRVLVLLIAMGGLLAVPAFASAHSDLSLLKVVDHAEAAPGDLLTYTIQIQNHGTHASAAGTVTDALPAHTTFVSASAGCTAAGGLITCPLAPVAVGATVSITVTVRVDDDAPAGDLVNMADVTRARRPADDEQPRRGDHDRAASPASATSCGGIRTTTACRRAASPASPGVTVHLYDGAGALVATTTTDAYGYYRFDRLRPNTTYGVCLDAPADSAPGGPLAGFELTGATPAADDAHRFRCRARERLAVHRAGADRPGGLVRPDLRLRLLEAGGDRRPGLGRRQPQRHPGRGRARRRRRRRRAQGRDAARRSRTP